MAKQIHRYKGVIRIFPLEERQNFRLRPEFSATALYQSAIKAASGKAVPGSLIQGLLMKQADGGLRQRVL